MFTKMFKRKSFSNKILFIVEDNEVYGKSLKGFIKANLPEINEIKIFRTGEMCLMEMHRSPGIVIVDYFLNSKYKEADNGLEIIKQIKNQYPNTHIIVLSSQESPGVIIQAISQYDCVYVQKDKDSFQHVERILKDFISRKSYAALEAWA